MAVDWGIGPMGAIGLIVLSAEIEDCWQLCKRIKIIIDELKYIYFFFTEFSLSINPSNS